MPNGWGLFRWPDGSSLYEGFWKNGCRHGNSGTLIVEDGFRYEGAWVDNAMEGRGIATVSMLLISCKLIVCATETANQSNLNFGLWSLLSVSKWTSLRGYVGCWT